MTPRFYAPDAHATGEEVTLPDEEATHLTRVLRLTVGDAVRVFDGRGLEFDAVVTLADRGGAAVRVGEPRTSAPEPRVPMTLVQAVLKGEKMDEVVRDTVMLGIGAIQPLVSERSEVTLAMLTRAGRRHRWERIAVSSAKQCGRAVVPPVREPIDIDGLVSRLAAQVPSSPAMLCVEPQAGAGASRLADLRLGDGVGATLIIGPEGGWTAEEIERVTPMARLITLGGRTLRADAAAVVAVSALQTILGEF